jgi:hypothetical protein
MLYVARLHIICSFSSFLKTATCALEMYLQYFPRGVSEPAALSSRRLFETPHPMKIGPDKWNFPIDDGSKPMRSYFGAWTSSYLCQLFWCKLQGAMVLLTRPDSCDASGGKTLRHSCGLHPAEAVPWGESQLQEWERNKFLSSM